MIIPDTDLILLKVPINIDSSNQINFTDATAQYNYFYSLEKDVETGFTYQRKDNIIRYNACMDDIIEFNYCMYKNNNYSDKWFYAYIDSMEYANDEMTYIKIKTDVYQTWQFDIQIKDSFVEREHVNNDTIGLHTIPEQLETGEYINRSDVTNFGIGSCHAVVCTSEDPFRQTETYPYNVVNSIPSGLHYFVVGDFTSVNFIGWVTDWAAKQSDLSLIQSILLIPDSMTGYDPTPSNYWSYAITGGFNYAPYHKLDTVITGSINMGDTSISKPYSNIDGYVPKNNKLFVWPYNYLIVDNNGGSCEEYRYEDFSTSNCVFNTQGSITPGCSIKTLPKNYKNVTNNYSESLNALKLPVGSWQGDVYTNWLTQNGVNLGVNFATSTAGIVSSVATGNVATGVSSILGIASTLGSVYEHSRIPNQVYGNQNSGDVTYSMGQSTFTAYKRNIKSEYARIIDNYFTMFGYKVSTVKKPNITGRRNWNYIKTINCNIEAYIPQGDLLEIKDLFDKGITIWHNPSTFLDYSQNNDILS